jgi:hypothetical protein
MVSIFISYRRKPAKPYADRLRDHLVKHYRDEEVFLDEASIAPGERWPARLQQALEKAIVVLVVIDSTWVKSSAKQPEGEDWVRIELERAIKLGKTIMPVVVGGHVLKLAAALKRLPSALHPIFSHQIHGLPDGPPAAYEASIQTLIEAIAPHLVERVATLEDAISELLMAKDYVAAEQLLIRQPSSSRPQANLSVYLALARLAGRSFNALHPAERQTIEMLLRRANVDAPDSELPKLLLALLDIDYYELNGIASNISIRPSDVVPENSGIDVRLRALLSNLDISPRARRELRLDSFLSGAARC